MGNDLGWRSFQGLGRHQDNRDDYWGAAKSFAGFTPVGDSMWVPATQQPNSIVCTTLTTTVNDEVRQQQSAVDMIYTPKQMLRFIAEAYPEVPLKQGDVVLTGTPPGVALILPRWRVRFAELASLSRFASLATVIGTYKDDPRFLQSGDRVTVSSPLLGASSVLITQ